MSFEYSWESGGYSWESESLGSAKLELATCCWSRARTPRTPDGPTAEPEAGRDCEAVSCQGVQTVWRPAAKQVDLKLT